MEGLKGSAIGAMDYNRKIQQHIQQEVPQRRQAPVAESLDAGDVAVSRLESEWMDLISRLSPIYRQELANGPAGDCVMPPTSCELESRIQSQGYRVAKIAEAMSLIREKLCI